MGKYSGQYLPRKKGKDGKWKDDQKINGKDDKNAKKSLENDDDAADEVAGYGIPTAGVYDTTKKGTFKTFGTIGQGDVSKGARNKDDQKCKKRKIIVTVANLPKPNNTNSTPQANELIQVSDSLTQDLTFLVDEQPLGEDPPMMTLSVGSANFLNSAAYMKVAAAGMVAVAASLI